MGDRFLVFQQVPHEGLGSIEAALLRVGAELDVIPCYRADAVFPNLSNYAGLIVLGGPMSVNDIHNDPPRATQLALIQQAVETDFPTLGICLGAQLIALAAGAQVRPGNLPEIGWFDVDLSAEAADDPLFAELTSPLSVFQWHGEGADLPIGATPLASSPRFANQAFRLGQRVYALQFHLEIEAVMIAEWMEANRVELARLGNGVDMADLSHDAVQRCRRLNDWGQTVMARWLAMTPIASCVK